MHGTEGSRAKHILKKELLRGGEQSQILSLAPRHHLLLLSISDRYVTAYRTRSCTTCSATRDQVGRTGSAPCLPISQGKDDREFCSQHRIIWVPFPCPKILIKLGNVYSFYFRLTLLFYLSYISQS